VPTFDRCLSYRAAGEGAERATVTTWEGGAHSWLDGRPVWRGGSAGGLPLEMEKSRLIGLQECGPRPDGCAPWTIIARPHERSIAWDALYDDP